MRQPVSLNATLNSTVSFNCTAEGLPPPTYTWFVLRENANETLVDEPLPNEIESLLTFEGVRPVDRGVYSCSATNRLNTSYSSELILSIEGKLTKVVRQLFHFINSIIN